MSGKGTLNNMNRTLIGILCQKIWLHACFTFQSISLSLIFNCGINHSPTKKNERVQVGRMPLTMKSSHWISQKLWFETKLKKGTATRGESNPSDSVGSSSPQKPVNQWWFQKETKPATVSAGKKISGSNLRFIDLEKLVLYLGDCFSRWHFFDAFGILRCSWCMEYLPALHWNYVKRLCGEMARHPDPHWIDEQALKPRDSRKLGGLAWQGMEPFWERRVSELFCVWETMMCVFEPRNWNPKKHGEKNSYSYTTHHNPSTSWKKDRLILIIPRMDPRLLHVTW